MTKPVANPTQTNNAQIPPQSQATTLGNTASSSPLSIDDVFSIPDQIQADMEAATAGITGNSLTNWDEDIFLKNHHYTTEPELRLRPSTGRTININKGSVDLARGFRLLQKAVNQNGIKRDMIMQRAHERPALKRKRQKRERWQQRFQSSFRATMNRVFELKAQGW
jgi:small subunit ribosomal protein MRP21